MRRILPWLGPSAGILGILLLVFGTGYYLSPTHFKVAVAPGAGERVLKGFADHLASENSFRLEVVSYPDVKQTAQALEASRADFGVVQPDVLFPTNAATIAILREEPLIFLANEKISEIREIKRLAIIRSETFHTVLIKRILEHYGLREIDVTDLSGEVASSDFKRFEAIAFFAEPKSDQTAELVRATVASWGEGVKVIPLPAVPSLTTKMPGISEASTAAGSLLAWPPLPTEDVKTVAISYRLVGLARLDRPLVSSLTEQLFQKRQLLARSAPEANLMKAPAEDAMTAIIPNHRGAVDYYNREQLTFMDRYGDWLWLSLFAVGGLSSIGGWLAQTVARRRREAVDDVLGRLLAILKEARKSNNVEELDALKLEIDDLVARAVRHTRRKMTNTRTMSALMLAIDSARGAIDDRKQDLRGPSRPKAQRRSTAAR
jgi:TRAP-type uncharacterized transport system substrate-binding protein